MGLPLGSPLSFGGGLFYVQILAVKAFILVGSQKRLYYSMPLFLDFLKNLAKSYF